MPWLQQAVFDVINQRIQAAIVATGNNFIVFITRGKRCAAHDAVAGFITDFLEPAGPAVLQQGVFCNIRRFRIAFAVPANHHAIERNLARICRADQRLKSRIKCPRIELLIRQHRVVVRFAAAIVLRLLAVVIAWVAAHRSITGIVCAGNRPFTADLNFLPFLFIHRKNVDPLHKLVALHRGGFEFLLHRRRDIKRFADVITMDAVQLCLSGEILVK